MTSLLDPGTEVAGYRVLGELGRGGMGLVYEAEHLRLGRKAALKLLTPDFAADTNVRERFVQESRLIAAIDHPNIIPIYDAGEIEGTLYIAMRLVAGGDLAKLIGQGPIDAERTLTLVEQAAAALDAAHARGMVHRDVKPANVLLEDPSAGRVFLTDFGVAKLTGGASETKAGMFIGSVDYASPEQIEGGAIAPTVDVYALGCVLYECLTGRRPYHKATNVATLFSHLRDPPPRVTDHRPELGEAIDEVVATALAKDPAERYGSCGELAAAARAALSGEEEEAAREQRRVGTKPGRPERAPLPKPETELVGRATELEAVLALLGDPNVSIVTLTGPGGTGKTRLALAAAGAAADQFPGGAILVELETLTDAGLVLAAVAERLGSSDAGVEGLARQLAEERPLLVLDNFEHVLPAASQVGALVSAAPGAKVLVTSRAPLRVRAERELPVPPLEPASAIELFAERARDIQPGFELDGENAEAVAEICARLDGLPLAIELAAARVRLLSPAAMLSRLDRRLALLTSTAQDVPSRHRTMRGTVEWSYELLEEPARLLLSRLAVFSGGWTMAAAERVCAIPPELDAEAVLDATAALVDGSLVRSVAGAGGEPRFELLQIVQEFGTYQLIERGELDEIRRRHAEFFLELAETAEPDLTGPNQAAWLARLAAETGNLRAALRWSEESNALELGLRLAGALHRFWSVQGLMAEIRPWLDRALTTAEVPSPVRAKALYAAGHAAIGQGRLAEATTRFEEGLELSRELGDEVGQAGSLAQLGWLAHARGDADAASAISTRSLAIAEEIGALGIASVARSTLAELAAQRGAYAQAAELLEQSLQLRRRLGDRRNIANALLGLARVEYLRSDAKRAASLAEEGLELAREVADTWSTALGTVTLGLLALDAGRADEARRRLVEALELSWRRADDRNVTESLFALAAAAAAAGDERAAARRWGAAEALRSSIGASPSPTERTLEERYLAGLRRALGGTAFEDERQAGAGLPLEQAVDLALG